MNKNRKVIIIVGVIVLAILLLAMLFYLNFRIHILRVTEISEKTLETSEDNENITYFMYVNNDTNIYKNFKKSKITDLKSNDLVIVINKVPKVMTTEAYVTNDGKDAIKIPDVKFIVVLNSNYNKFVQRSSYIIQTLQRF